MSEEQKTETKSPEWTPEQMVLWQRKKCQESLDMAVCEQKGRAGQQMDYVEHVYVRARLNEIFGPHGWSSETVDGPTEVFGEIGLKQDYQTKRCMPVYRCGWICKVKLIIRWADGRETCHTGTGFCTGTANPHVPQDAPEGARAIHFTDRESPIDMACKGAESDAFKRAASNLGWSFGLALYQKPDKREHVFDSRQQRANRGAPQ